MEHEEEKLLNELADAVLINEAARKFKAAGGWKKLGGLFWRVFLIAGGVALILSPVVLGLLLLTKQMDLQEAFDEFGPAFGCVYVIVYLLLRWLLRLLIKTVKRDPGYFDRRKSIMDVNPKLGFALIIGSVAVAFLSLTGNSFWFFVFAFTGCFLPFSRFLSDGSEDGSKKHDRASGSADCDTDGPINA